MCFVFFVNCTPCHAHLWGFLCPIFVVACVRGHLIVIVCVINNTDGSSFYVDGVTIVGVPFGSMKGIEVKTTEI